jgi:hypothetical protein
VNDDQLQDDELRAVAQGLGRRAGDRLDVERTSAAVLRRLREQPAVTPWARPRVAWLRLAAAVVLVVGAGALLRTARRPTAAVPAAAAGVDLGDLSADQLHEILNTIDRPSEDEGSGDTGLDGLTAGELRSLLRSLEG